MKVSKELERCLDNMIGIMIMSKMNRDFAKYSFSAQREIDAARILAKAFGGGTEQ